MQETTTERIRDYLCQKRAVLSDWLSASSSDEVAVRCPEGPRPVLAHLGSIDEAIARTGAGTLGVCTVCGEVVEERQLEMDYASCVCLTHLSSEQVAHLEEEIELARTVQRALLPAETPRIAGLDVAAYSRPAEFVGGDYFDFVDFRTGAKGILIADVAGHGMSAGLQMANLQALARAIIPASDSPDEVAGHLHGLLRHNVRFTTFVTMFISAFDPQARTLSYCNAGHNPPLLLHRESGRDTSLEWLHPTGPAVGLPEEARFDRAEQGLHTGDVLVLYTDGVVEAANHDDDFFGSEGLARAVQRWQHAPARQIVSGIRQSIEEFVVGRPLADDVTLVVCRAD